MNKLNNEENKKVDLPEVKKDENHKEIKEKGEPLLNKELKKDSSKQTEKIVYLEEEGNKDPHRLTWQRMVNHVGRYKYWVLGASLVGLLAGFLGVNYLYNPKVQTFSSTFKLVLPVDPTTNTFVDGSTFNYQNLISETTINKINQRLGEGKGYDLASLDDLSISQYTVTVDNKTTVVPLTYTISGSISSFKTVENVEAFINDVTQQAVLDTKEVYEKYLSNNYLSMIDSTSSYAIKLSYLDETFQAINNTFNSLITTYGSSSTLKIDDKDVTLKSEQEQFQMDFLVKEDYNFLDWNTFEYKTGTVSTKIIDLASTYIGNSTDAENSAFIDFDDSNKASLKASIESKQTQVDNQIASITEEKNSIQEEIRLIIESGSGSGTGNTGSGEITSPILEKLLTQLNSYNVQLNALNRRKVFLTNQLTNVQRPVEAQASEQTDKNYYANKKAFISLIDEYKQNLSNYITNFTNSLDSLFDQFNTVSYTSSSKVTINGGLSSLIGAAGGLVGFFLLSAIAVICVGQYKLRKYGEKKIESEDEKERLEKEEKAKEKLIAANPKNPAPQDVVFDASMLDKTKPNNKK